MKFVLLLLSILATLVISELPSCYRARCSHCSVVFIAQMCPSTCSGCQGVRDSLKTNSGPRIRPGSPHNNADHNNSAAKSPPSGSIRTHEQPTSNHHTNLKGAKTNIPSGASARAAPIAKTIPSTLPKQPPPAFNQQVVASNSGQTQQQFVVQPQNYQQQVYPQQQVYQPQQIQQQGFVQSQRFIQGYPQPNPTVQGYPPQSQYFLQQQQQQPAQSFDLNSFNAQSSAQAPQSVQQPVSPFANPFQPFLQQSYHAQGQHQQPQLFQQQQATVPPFPAVTPSPALYVQGQELGTRQVQGPFFGQLQVQQQQQAGAAFRIPPPPPPPATLVPQQQVNGQQQYVVYLPEPQRPKQLYNQPTPQQPAQPQQPVPISLASISPIPQQRPPPAQHQSKYSTSALPNIDSPSGLYVNKNVYAEKMPVAGTCPKQPNWEPCISKDVANERFRNCCQNLGDGCTQLCSYDQTLTTIQLAVLTGRCPISKVASMMLCASGYEDATPCCEAFNVFEPGYAHCRPYCNPAAGLPSGNDGMLAEKYRCLAKLNQIQRCFYVTQKP